MESTVKAATSLLTNPQNATPASPHYVTTAQIPVIADITETSAQNALEPAPYVTIHLYAKNAVINVTQICVLITSVRTVSRKININLELVQLVVAFLLVKVVSSQVTAL